MKPLILKLARRGDRLSRNQSGLASMVVTGILIALIGLVAVGFATVMRREVTKSVNNQISQTAYDAAQSGVNDAINYLKTHPTTSATQCSDLVGSGKPLAASSVLSSDGNTKYTCVLINPNPSDLQYQSVPPQQSQVTRIDTSAKLSALLLSWQATDNALTKFPACGATCPLYDESTWSNSQYAPMLRVTIYPVPASTMDPNLAYATANAKTYFFYPIKDADSNVDSLAFSTASGLKQVGCGSTGLGTFTGSTTSTCNIKITGFNTASQYYYYAQITPIYADTNVRIQANDSTNTVITFKNTQAVIDVTSQSGSALKRLQARVDTSGQSGITEDISVGSNGFSPYALRSGDAICKRLIIPSAAIPAYTDANSVPECANSIPPPQPPDVVTGDVSNLSPPNLRLNGTVNPKSSNVGTCQFVWSSRAADSSRLGDDTQSLATAGSPYSIVNCHDLPGSGSDPVSVYQNISLASQSGANTPGKVIYYQLYAKNAVNKISYGQVKSFVVTGKPSISNCRTTGITSTSATLSCDVNPDGFDVTACTFQYGKTSAYGTNQDCSPLPGAGTAPVAESTFVSGLHSCTPYHWRLVAQNSAGTTNGTDVGPFTTSGCITSSSSSSSSSTGPVPTCNAFSIQQDGGSTNADVHGDCSNASTTQYSASFTYGDGTESCGTDSHGWQSSSTFTFPSFRNIQASGSVRGQNANGWSSPVSTSGQWNYASGATCNGSGGSSSSNSSSSSVPTSSTSSTSSSSSSGGGSCFIASTEVLVPGGQKPISQIKVGDTVETWNTTTSKMESSRVVQTYIHYDKPTLWILTTGGQVTTTREHRFWTGDAWVVAGSLKTGSYVYDSSGHKQQVIMTMTGQHANVYNLHVESANHDYFANDFLVHNFKGNTG